MFVNGKQQRLLTSFTRIQRLKTFFNHSIPPPPRHHHQATHPIQLDRATKVGLNSLPTLYLSDIVSGRTPAQLFFTELFRSSLIVVKHRSVEETVEPVYPRRAEKYGRSPPLADLYLAERLDNN